jgi:hypothetical protein
MDNRVELGAPGAQSELCNEALVLELDALLDARRALMLELLALDAQVATYMERLLARPDLAHGQAALIK